MELAFQVRKNKKQSMISGGLGTAFRGDKGSDEEECSRDMGFFLSSTASSMVPQDCGSSRDGSSGLRAVRVAWRGELIKDARAQHQVGCSVLSCALAGPA